MNMHSMRGSTELPTPGPRPNMDKVLKGYVSRAEALLQSRERMGALLEAVVAVAEDLSMDAVLERVVQSACRLVHARYGVLAVTGDNREPDRFITLGMDGRLKRETGPLPSGQGEGAHGLPATDAGPLRLLRLQDLRRRAQVGGFPAADQPLQACLSIPIRVRDTVFANLYLAEKEDRGDFTEEDEGLAVALAAASGVAIENARLYDDARRRARWLEACMDVSGLMLGSDRDYTAGGLEPIAARARQESGSTLALIVAESAAGPGYIVAGAAGDGASTFSGRSLDLGLPVLEDVLAGGEPVLFEDASVLLPGPDGGNGPLLAVALSTQGAHYGLLLLARGHGSAGFDRTDAEMGAVFGSHVALALELARVHRLREQLLVFTDRDRIARDLHDLVIQRLFAAGLSVQNLARFTRDGVAHERIRTITGELDEAIRSLRDTIYSLKSSSGEIEGLSGRIRRVTRSSAKSMPFAPQLTLTGPVDTVTPDKADNVVAVVSEGLSNAIRHSGADSISVSVAVMKGKVTVVVTDNGSGFTEPEKRNGLANLEDRARMLDGQCIITSRPDAGTSLEWSVPL